MTGEKDRPQPTESEFGFSETKLGLTPEQIRLLSDLISSIGNSEAKAATIVLMNPGTLYTPFGLKKMFTEGTGGVWPIAERTLWDYCRKTFEPIGLVAKTATMNPGTETERKFYYVTQRGIEIGKAFAAYSIQYSNQIDMSLQKLWGETHTPSPDQTLRPPIIRLQIIAYISQNPDCRLVDLETMFGLYRSVLKVHLSALGSLGIIDQSGFNFRVSEDPTVQTIAHQIIPTLINFAKGNPRAAEDFNNLVGDSDFTRQIATAVQRAKDNSTHHRWLTTQERQRELLAIIRSSEPDGGSITDLTQCLGWKKSVVIDTIGKLSRSQLVQAKGYPRRYTV